jgi:hypothetical protein
MNPVTCLTTALDEVLRPGVDATDVVDEPVNYSNIHLKSYQLNTAMSMVY